VTAVIDTSPIVALARLRLLHLLPDLFGEAIIPRAVHAEVLLGRPDAPEVPAIREALEARSLAARDLTTPSDAEEFRGTLGQGEAEVIALARETGADAVVIDDRAARRMAGRIGLTVVGTVGVLLMARATGRLATVMPLVEALRSQGFRISDAVLSEIREERPHG
jgi:predicted nucleic acid-binding protein